jgi:protein SCO1/2
LQEEKGKIMREGRFVHHLVMVGLMLGLGVSAVVAGNLPSMKMEGHRTHAMQGEQAGAAAHAAHRATMEQVGYQRSVHRYRVPNVELVDFFGHRTSLPQELPMDRPVLLNFIYTTCPTICPVLGATFYQVQKNLGEEASQVRMLSITIDPEKDMPEQLRDYAKRYGAGPQWVFLTGELNNIIAVQKAFDIYRGSKVNHEPVTFLRPAGSSEWIRLDGIARAGDIIQEYQGVAVNGR